MSIRYSPDTCNCVILLESDCKTFFEWEKKCAKHKKFDGQKLFDEIAKTNRETGPLKIGSKPTKAEMTKSIQAKQKAKRENLKLGKPIINKK